MKHTTGEWVALRTQSKYGSWGVFIKPECYSALDNSAPHANAEANARLMAAAPELLAACEAAFKCGTLPALALMELQRAIEKARGQ